MVRSVCTHAVCWWEVVHNSAKDCGLESEPQAKDRCRGTAAPAAWGDFGHAQYWTRHRNVVTNMKIQVLVHAMLVGGKSIERPEYRFEHVDQYHEQHCFCMVTALSPSPLDGLL